MAEQAVRRAEKAIGESNATVGVRAGDVVQMAELGVETPLAEGCRNAPEDKRVFVRFADLAALVAAAKAKLAEKAAAPPAESAAEKPRRAPGRQQQQPQQGEAPADG
jgi:hypothetical protein